MSYHIQEENFGAVMNSQENTNKYFDCLDTEDTERYKKMKEVVREDKKAAATFEQLAKVNILLNH